MCPEHISSLFSLFYELQIFTDFFDFRLDNSVELLHFELVCLDVLAWVLYHAMRMLQMCYDIVSFKVPELFAQFALVWFDANVEPQVPFQIINAL